MTVFSTLPRSFLVCLLPILLTACDSGNDEPDPVPLPTPRTVAEADYTVTASGLKYFDFVIGTDSAAVVGDAVLVHYNGWLTNGQLFDSSYLRGQPYLFLLGRGQVIRGWDEGVANMRIGGQRQLVIPPELAYGSTGQGSIPPNATLIFEVELVDLP